MPDDRYAALAREWLRARIEPWPHPGMQAQPNEEDVALLAGLLAVVAAEAYKRGSLEQLEVSGQYVEQVRMEEREWCAKVREGTIKCRKNSTTS